MSKSFRKGPANLGGSQRGHARARSNAACIEVERSWAPSAAPHDSEVRPAYRDILSSFQSSKWAPSEQLLEMSGHQAHEAWSGRSAYTPDAAGTGSRHHVSSKGPRPKATRFGEYAACAGDLTAKLPSHPRRALRTPPFAPKCLCHHAHASPSFGHVQTHTITTITTTAASSTRDLLCSLRLKNRRCP